MFSLIGCVEPCDRLPTCPGRALLELAPAPPLCQTGKISLRGFLEAFSLSGYNKHQGYFCLINIISNLCMLLKVMFQAHILDDRGQQRMARFKYPGGWATRAETHMRFQQEQLLLPHKFCFLSSLYCLCGSCRFPSVSPVSSHRQKIRQQVDLLKVVS